VLLPPQEGRITTRGLQEWSCLLPQDLSFEPVARLLGWQTQDPQMLSSTTVRRLVRAHGGLIRPAEAAEMAVLGQRSDRATLWVSLVPHRRTRHRAGWPLELSAAVDAARAREHPRPPEGVSWADGDRVLAIRRLEVDRSNQDLRHLGPPLAPGQVLLTIDEVLVRTQARQRFPEVHTALIVTAAGARSLSGVGEPFLQQIVLLPTGCLGPGRSLPLIADGARWIRAFFQERLAALPGATVLLDWYHLQQKGRQACSRICQRRVAKEQFLRRLYRRLWAGEVPAALRRLEAYRPQARDGAAIETLIGDLAARQAWIPNDRQRRRQRQYIRSGQVEKANDLLVARRQKGHGRHWGAQTSQGLLALRTLQLNGGWERYGRHRQVLPLASY
jgi:hypothetical protein